MTSPGHMVDGEEVGGEELGVAADAARAASPTGLSPASGSSQSGIANASFTAEDIAEGEEYQSLGPEYFAARRVTERAMASFQDEHFKPLLDAFADQFADKLWDSVRDHLLSDTEMNLQTSVCGMVEGTIRALLTGEEWAMRRYPFCDYRDGEKIRKAIAEHSGDAVARARIADLEAEVARLTESLRSARGHF
jgi:hypothetical protein